MLQTHSAAWCTLSIIHLAWCLRLERSASRSLKWSRAWAIQLRPFSQRPAIISLVDLPIFPRYEIRCAVVN